jgi:hypothetical protein
MEIGIMKDILTEAFDPQSESSEGLNPRKPGTPPRNIIVPKKKVDEWDETFGRVEKKVDGLILDLDAGRLKQDAVYDEIRAIARWAAIRDIIIILLLVMIGAVIGFNTTQLWGWQ